MDAVISRRSTSVVQSGNSAATVNDGDCVSRRISSNLGGSSAVSSSMSFDRTATAAAEAEAKRPLRASTTTDGPAEAKGRLMRRSTLAYAAAVQAAQQQQQRQPKATTVAASIAAPPRPGRPTVDVLTAAAEQLSTSTEQQAEGNQDVACDTSMDARHATDWSPTQADAVRTYSNMQGEAEGAVSTLENPIFEAMGAQSGVFQGLGSLPDMEADVLWSEMAVRLVDALHAAAATVLIQPHNPSDEEQMSATREVPLERSQRTTEQQTVSQGGTAVDPVQPGAATAFDNSGTNVASSNVENSSPQQWDPLSNPNLMALKQQLKSQRRRTQQLHLELEAGVLPISDAGQCVTGSGCCCACWESLQSCQAALAAQHAMCEELRDMNMYLQRHLHWALEQLTVA